MPELPEVEIVCRELRTHSVNFSINNCFYSGKKFKRDVPNLNQIVGQTIKNIHRRNKYIVLELDDFWLVFHLGMTGRLILKEDSNIRKHEHVILYDKQKNGIFFEDPRRFGSVDLFLKSKYLDYKTIPLFEKLGYEPLENTFTFESFAKLTESKNNIKKFLMDAQYVCGIGNIYASEILFLSQVSPLRLVSSLTKDEKKKIYQNIKKILTKAIELGGSSISDFVHTNGLKGEMQNFYKVYGLAGKPCFDCGSNINRLTQNGRGTYFCSTCQK